MARWRWIVQQITRRLWFRATLIGMAGVVTAGLAAIAERYIPWEMPGSIGADAVDSILGIIASSMLAVTTFSLSVMTSAYGSATSNVTPRATRLLMEDRTAQNVLSTFIGSFLFSIVGIVVLKAGAYGDRGRVVLFVVTIGVIALIVVSLLRWIDHLTHFGRVGETTDRVERATRQALDARLAAPGLGGAPQRGGAQAIPHKAAPVPARAIGYVQFVDIGALSRLAEECDADIHVAALPGSFVYLDSPLAWIAPPRRTASGPEEKLEQKDEDDTIPTQMRAAFSIGSERNFDQDPRFGLAVMSEIASRALSPGVNDPGTAIDVIGRSTRLLCHWAEGGDGASEVRFPRVHVPVLVADDLFEDAFMLVARDGAGLVEVQLRLRKALLALGRMGDASFRAAARHQAEMALARAQAALSLEADRQRLAELAAEDA
ncbi:DUF2254 domain-containing protein [Ancylobacter radicis]|uniref:DUF2254 domain-containing protein n=1 Tax=Ancylobacter radicis TaxID=2836179 RepID=A0ABS5RBA3_9HYPH|nr:DUF2254 domain-containing protein [Ancylobacter radicis]MBS9478944.1 DUF2254 domain-containing protein [Ancylobacter radicis]